MGPARIAVTSRLGGVSRPPYDANNLALHVGDNPDTVRRNREALASALGVDRVQFMSQVHGSDIAVVGAAGDGDIAGVDALVTATPGVAVAVLVADCVPVVVGGRRAVAVAHAGRRGVADGVVTAAVAAVRELDDGPLQGRIGPAVCGRCYEVPRDMQEELARAVPAAATTTRRGTPGLDLPAAVRQQLADSDVDVVDSSAVCTLEDRTYYSYRRDAVTGRFAVVAMLTR
jgi:YfiH family protein